MHLLFLWFYYIFTAIKAIPLLVMVVFSRNKNLIFSDVERWCKVKLNCIYLTKWQYFKYLLYFIISFLEFRSIIYYRIGFRSNFFKFLLLPMPNLYIQTKEIGGGLFIQHGFSTIIAAKKIGNNCWINQQVTIGFSNVKDCPVIGNNVTIYAGAKVMGGIIIGDNSIVGCNAVIVKDVPPNCTVVGVPGRIIKRDGKKIE